MRFKITDELGSIENPGSLLEYFNSIGGMYAQGPITAKVYKNEPEFSLTFTALNFPQGFDKPNERKMSRHVAEKFLALTADNLGKSTSFTDYEAELFHERDGDIWVVKVWFGGTN